MAKFHCTDGLHFQTVTPQEFINQMIRQGIADTREEAIALAIFNDSPVLSRRNWDRACYQNGTVSDATAIKLALILQFFTQVAA
jgi:hypothetical protein